MQALPWFCRNHEDCSVSVKNVFGVSSRDCTESADGFGQCGRFVNVISSDPQTRGVFPTVCLLQFLLADLQFSSHTDLSVPWINSSQLFVFDAIVNGTVLFLFQMLTISVKEYN